MAESFIGQFDIVVRTSPFRSLNIADKLLKLTIDTSNSTCIRLPEIQFIIAATGLPSRFNYL